MFGTSSFLTEKVDGNNDVNYIVSLEDFSKLSHGEQSDYKITDFILNGDNRHIGVEKSDFKEWKGDETEFDLIVMLGSSDFISSEVTAIVEERFELSLIDSPAPTPTPFFTNQKFQLHHTGRCV